MEETRRGPPQAPRRIRIGFEETFNVEITEGGPSDRCLVKHYERAHC